MNGISEKPVVLVTGAGAGIGLATVELLAKEGFQVAAVARKDEDLRRLAAISPDVCPFKADLSMPDDIAKLSDDIKSRYRGVDVLVNNAGYGLRGAVEDCPVDAVREMFEVNVFAPLSLVKYFLPFMRARKKGLIINVSSVTGIWTSPFNGLYASAKHALEGWSDALRMEVDPFGVRVVLVQPGPVATNFLTNAERRSETVLSNADSPYAGIYKKMPASVSSLHKSAVKPEKVARLVLRIVRAKRPRARYRVHFIARVAPFLLSFIPRRWLDRLLQKIVGLR